MEKELYHHGIKGMKWGVRRYQNKDGSLTPAGKRRYDDDTTKKKINSINSKTAAKIKKIRAEAKAKAKIAKAEEKAAAKLAKEEAKYKAKNEKPSESKSKSIKDMTDDEIRQKINRIRLEKELSSLQPERVSAGKKFTTSLKDNVIAPAAKDAGRRLLTDFLNKKGAELLGISKKDAEDATAALKKEVEKMNLQKQKNELNKYWEREKAKNAKKNASDDKDDSSKSSSKSGEKQKNETAGKEDKKVYEGEVYGEGTSKGSSPFSKKSHTFVDAEFTDVSMNEVSKNTSLISSGRNYVDEILRIEGS